MNEQLAQSVRRLIDATTRTQVDVQTVAAVKGRIDWATEQLSAALIPGSFGVHQTSDGRSMALGNVVIGARNPVAPPLAIHDDADGAVRTDFVLGAAYEGPPGMVHGGLWHTADTLPELAAKIVVDADNLVSTVKRFNEFVAAGVDDDFGRGTKPTIVRSRAGGPRWCRSKPRPITPPNTWPRACNGDRTTGRDKRLTSPPFHASIALWHLFSGTRIVVSSSLAVVLASGRRPCCASWTKVAG